MPFPDFIEDSHQAEPPAELDRPEPMTPESLEQYQKAKQSAKKLYFILLAIGLGVGILASIGVVTFLQRFGLTEVPPRVESNE